MALDCGLMLHRHTGLAAQINTRPFSTWYRGSPSCLMTGPCFASHLFKASVPARFLDSFPCQFRRANLFGQGFPVLLFYYFSFALIPALTKHLSSSLSSTMRRTLPLSSSGLGRIRSGFFDQAFSTRSRLLADE